MRVPEPGASISSYLDVIVDGSRGECKWEE